MVRIRYNQIGDLLYTDWFTIGPNHVIKGIININNNTYQVIQFNTDVVAEGSCPNLRAVKFKLKQVLAQAGVNFDGEIRGARL